VLEHLRPVADEEQLLARGLSGDDGNRAFDGRGLPRARADDLLVDAISLRVVETEVQARRGDPAANAC
jgi:hypothetical protein